MMTPVDQPKEQIAKTNRPSLRPPEGVRHTSDLATTEQIQSWAPAEELVWEDDRRSPNKVLTGIFLRDLVPSIGNEDQSLAQSEALAISRLSEEDIPMAVENYFGPRLLITKEEDSGKAGSTQWALKQISDHLISLKRGLTNAPSATLRNHPKIHPHAQNVEEMVERGIGEQYTPEYLEQFHESASFIGNEISQLLSSVEYPDSGYPLALMTPEFMATVTSPNATGEQRKNALVNYMALNRGTPLRELLLDYKKNSSNEMPLDALGTLLVASLFVREDATYSDLYKDGIDDNSKAFLETILFGTNATAYTGTGTHEIRDARLQEYLPGDYDDAVNNPVSRSLFSLMFKDANNPLGGVVLEDGTDGIFKLIKHFFAIESTIGESATSAIRKSIASYESPDWTPEHMLKRFSEEIDRIMVFHSSPRLSGALDREFVGNMLMTPEEEDKFGFLAGASRALDRYSNFKLTEQEYTEVLNETVEMYQNPMYRDQLERVTGDLSESRDMIKALVNGFLAQKPTGTPDIGQYISNYISDKSKKDYRKISSGEMPPISGESIQDRAIYQFVLALADTQMLSGFLDQAEDGTQFFSNEKFDGFIERSHSFTPENIVVDISAKRRNELLDLIPSEDEAPPSSVLRTMLGISAILQYPYEYLRVNKYPRFNDGRDTVDRLGGIGALITQALRPMPEQNSYPISPVQEHPIGQGATRRINARTVDLQTDEGLNAYYADQVMRDEKNIRADIAVRQINGEDVVSVGLWNRQEPPSQRLQSVQGGDVSVPYKDLQYMGLWLHWADRTRGVR